MSLKTKIDAAHVVLRSLVLEGARAGGAVRLHTHYADNYWTVTVHSDGQTTYENYAEEARGPRGNIDDLSMWELASMLETLRR